jgi:hypothetical protein
MKFPFQITGWKEVIRTDIRGVEWPGSMSELAKLKAISVAVDRRGVALLKCAIGLGGPAARPLCRISESGSSIFSQK